MNKKELKQKAKKLAALQRLAKNQKLNNEDEALQNTLYEMNNIMETLSLEELFKLDAYMQEELKCN